jgi:hypothetical protein
MALFDIRLYLTNLSLRPPPGANLRRKDHLTRGILSSGGGKLQKFKKSLLWADFESACWHGTGATTNSSIPPTFRCL